MSDKLQKNESAVAPAEKFADAVESVLSETRPDLLAVAKSLCKCTNPGHRDGRNCGSRAGVGFVMCSPDCVCCSSAELPAILRAIVPRGEDTECRQCGGIGYVSMPGELVDCASCFGTGVSTRDSGTRSLQQHLFREVCDRALASGAEVYCIYHDCDIKNCPAGAHND